MPKKLTKEEFITRSIAKHGSKYDYSKVEYNGNHEKVKIICPVHGEFYQTPSKHMSGQGCIKCAYIENGERTRDKLDSFLEKARAKHGNKYDYSKVEYKGRQYKICIICPTHGEFWQTAGNHLCGSQCPKCLNHYSPTTEEFIERAREIHGEKFDYSKVVYENTMKKVCIICPFHGEFWQTPNEHLQGSGCAACSGVKKLTKEEFINKAQLKHGIFYDYSKVNYTNGKEKVCIICPEHGEFWQKPNSHLNGQGCKICGRKKTISALSSSKEVFIEKAIKIHSGKYDYSKVDYSKSTTKVCIICPEHGEFWQSPLNHLRTHGCPKCVKRFYLPQVGKERKPKAICATVDINEKSKEEIIKINTSTFIEKARQVHGEKYDYTKSVYIGSKKKICIICPEHGEFWQNPYGHIVQKYGCRKCANKEKGINRRLSTDNIVERFIKIHGSCYDYRKVDYKGSVIDVCIICPKHGEFWQRPFNHLKGSICPECNKENMSKLFRCTQEEWLEKVKAVHGNKYDYSKAVYKGTDALVCIICPEHGEFWQTANNHLRGANCLKCAYIENGEKYAKTFEDFIAQAKEIHGDKYDYSLAKDVYKRRMDTIPIICPEHGTFWQVAMNHLCGNGCPTCSESQLERTVRLCLERHNIKYEVEKTFSWLKHKGKMWLDLYLPEYKTAIECQGVQHFVVSDFFGGKKSFDGTVERDKKKKELCEEHGIKVLYFSDLHIDYPYEVIEDTPTLLNTIKSRGYRVIHPCRQLKLKFED